MLSIGYQLLGETNFIQLSLISVSLKQKSLIENCLTDTHVIFVSLSIICLRLLKLKTLIGIVN